MGGGSRKSHHATAKHEAGVNKLIDWLFAINSVIELHTFLVTLVRQFDFSLPENGKELKKTRLGAIAPVVVGEEQKGPQLPLKVTIIGDA